MLFCSQVKTIVPTTYRPNVSPYLKRKIFIQKRSYTSDNNQKQNSNKLFESLDDSVHPRQTNIGRVTFEDVHVQEEQKESSELPLPDMSDIDRELALDTIRYDYLKGRVKIDPKFMKGWDGLSLEDKEKRVLEMFHHENTQNLPENWDHMTEEQKENYYYNNYDKIEKTDEFREWKGDQNTEQIVSELAEKLGDVPKLVQDRMASDQAFSEEVVRAASLDEFGDKIFENLEPKDSQEMLAYDAMQKDGTIDAFIEELQELTDPDDPEDDLFKQDPIQGPESNVELFDNLNTPSGDVLNSFEGRGLSKDSEDMASFQGTEQEGEDEDISDVPNQEDVHKNERGLAEISLLTKVMGARLDMVRDHVLERNTEEQQPSFMPLQWTDEAETEQIQKAKEQSLYEKLLNVKNQPTQQVTQDKIENLDLSKDLQVDDLQNIGDIKERTKQYEKHLENIHFDQLNTDFYPKKLDENDAKILSTIKDVNSKYPANYTVEGTYLGFEDKTLSTTDKEIWQLFNQKFPQIQKGEYTPEDMVSMIDTFTLENPSYANSAIIEYLVSIHKMSEDQLLETSLELAKQKVSDGQTKPESALVQANLEKIYDDFPELKPKESQDENLRERVVRENKDLDIQIEKNINLFKDLQRKMKDISLEDSPDFQDTIPEIQKEINDKLLSQKEKKEKEEQLLNQANFEEDEKLSEFHNDFMSMPKNMGDNFEEFDASSPTLERKDRTEQEGPHRISEYNNTWDYLKAVGIFDTDVVDIQDSELDNLKEVNSLRKELEERQEYVEQFQKQYPLYGEEMDNFGLGLDRAATCGAGKCIFCSGQNNYYPLEPMNVPLLLRFMNRFGFIKPKRITGLCSKMQRRVARTIAQARNLGLFSYKYSRFEVLNPLVEKENPLYLDEEISFRIKELMNYKEDAKEIKRYLRWSTRPVSSGRISQKF